MSKQDVFDENPDFAAFAEKHGYAVAEDVCQRIAEAMWERKDQFGVHLSDIYQHNACNHTGSGTIDVDGTVYGFIFESGNNNGSVMVEWGLEDDVGTYKPEPVEPITFVPRDSALFTTSPALFNVYALWRKEEWFKEMERSYNYDRHFQPGGQIESHYRDKAAKRGLVPGYLSNMDSAPLAELKRLGAA